MNESKEPSQKRGEKKTPVKIAMQEESLLKALNGFEKELLKLSAGSQNQLDAIDASVGNCLSRYDAVVIGRKKVHDRMHEIVRAFRSKSRSS